MAKFNSKRSILCAAFILGMGYASPLMAVVARPGIQTVTQPDGTTIHVVRQGDAFHHRTYTTDGYLLMVDSEGFYVFADMGKDGFPTPTALRATDVEKRDTQTAGAVARLDQSRVAKAFDNLHDRAMNDRAQRLKRKEKKAHGLFSTHFPSKGEQKSIAILVEYTDKKFQIDNPLDHYRRMLNEPGFSDDGATGSARDYYVSNSGGLFSPEFDVYGPVLLSKPMSYYGAPDRDIADSYPEEMVIEACELLNDEIDFTQYDRNGDGVIDNVFVFYPGLGENDGGGEDAVWPHSSDITKILDREYYFDGMMLDHYACTNEMKSSGIPDGIGTFCHEFSHVMGLPDLYATIYTPSFTPGEYDIMDAGSYNNDSRTPPHYSSFERYALGYLEPEILNAEGEYTLNPLGEENRALMLPTERDNEYFLFENRQQAGSDLFIPGHGMLVWHIDFDQKIWDSNSVNNWGDHQYVDLVEADNKKTKGSRAGDPFPGSKGVTAFNSSKKPYLKSWEGEPLEFELADIAEPGDGTVTFRLVKTGGSGVEDIDMEKLPQSGIIYDISGREISRFNDKGMFGGVKLTPGIYVLKDGVSTKKIIVR